VFKLHRKSGARLVAIAAIGVLAAVGVTGATAAIRSHKANVQVCALLPDTKSSVRYVLFDAPDLTKAFKAAGLTSSVLNAQNSTQTQISQGEQCITNGAKVILVDALDSGTGATIEADAAKAGVKTIDYDRLVLKGSASYYVSFNNVTVGKLQGAGLVAALKANGMYGKKPVVAELNGSPTDNNATLFAQGYNSVLNPLYANGTLVKGPNQSVTAWDNQVALTDFQGMLAKTGNKINAVLAANDGIASSVVSALQTAKLSPVPLTGQDATPGGLQYILAGWQSGTVYKPVPTEAAAAAAVAIAMIKGTAVKTNGTTNNGVRNVPSVLLTPTWVTKKNYKVLFTSGFLKKSEVCIGTYKQYC
jgi:D-xylose transport system substrate-binding protein